MAASILSLPNELLQRIGDFLTPQPDSRPCFEPLCFPRACRHDLINYATTCQRLHGAAILPLKTFFTLSAIGAKVKHGDLDEILQNNWNAARRIKHLDISLLNYPASKQTKTPALIEARPEETPEDLLEAKKQKEDLAAKLQRLLDLVPKLEFLNLCEGNEWLNELWIGQRLSSYGKLHTLHLSGRLTSNQLADVFRIPSLRKLRVHDCRIRFDLTTKLPARSSNISNLELDALWLDSAASVAPLLNACKSLEDLTCGEMHSASPLLALDKSLEKHADSLKRLRLKGSTQYCEYMGPSFYSSFWNLNLLKNLKELEVPLADMLFPEDGMVKARSLPQSLQSLSITLAENEHVQHQLDVALDLASSLGSAPMEEPSVSSRIDPQVFGWPGEPKSLVHGCARLELPHVYQIEVRHYGHDLLSC